MWLTPKTDWVATDHINTEDYNRIAGNLQHIADEFNLIVQAHAEQNFTDFPFADKWNIVEDNLEEINRLTYQFNVGVKKHYLANQPYINYEELNRLERGILKIHNVYLSQLANGKHLSFTLGGTNIFDCPRGISIGSNEVMGNRLVFRLGEEKGGYLEDE